jgi:hypothetical protein
MLSMLVMSFYFIFEVFSFCCCSSVKILQRATPSDVVPDVEFRVESDSAVRICIRRREDRVVHIFSVYPRRLPVQPMCANH